MKTAEEFELKQSKMSDIELINLCQKEVGELASTYGKSHKMTIPPSIKDTDMLLSELIKRFKMLSEDARWRDPEKELPEKDEMVLIQVQIRYTDTIVKVFPSIGILSECGLTHKMRLVDTHRSNGLIIGWRPIE